MVSGGPRVGSSAKPELLLSFGVGGRISDNDNMLWETDRLKSRQRVGVAAGLCRGCVKRKGLLCRCCVSRKGLLCRLQSLINPKSMTMSSTAVGQFGCDGDAVGRGCCVSRKGDIVSVGRGMLCRLQSLINPKLITIRMLWGSSRSFQLS